MDGQLSLNPAWFARIVTHDGRKWLATTADALLHPSAQGMDFIVQNAGVLYTLIDGSRMVGPEGHTSMYRLRVEQHELPVHIGPDMPILLALEAS